MKVQDTEPKAPTRIDGALTAGSTPARSELGMTEAGQQLGLMSGALVVAGAETLYRFDRETSTFSAVPVGADGESMSTGPVRHLARRKDGLFVVAEGGLFHDDATGRLLRSPLSNDITASEVTALDDLGEGEGEELWLTTASSVDRIRAGVMTDVLVDHGGPVTAELSLGVDKDHGLVLARGNLYSVDLAAKTATWEAKDLPLVSAAARADDGTVYLATAKGLYARTRAGEVKLYSLAGAGEQPLAVTDVYSAFGETLVVAGGVVAQLASSGGGTSFGSIAAPHARGLARDGNGDTFALDGTALVKLATGRSVSFATDVVPFMTAHCTNCHTTGANYSPKFDLTDYAVVSAPAFLETIVKRITANGKPPMPPSDVEVLTSNDYAVVLRWVAGGKQP